MSNLDKIKEKLKKYEEAVEGIKKYQNAAIYPQQTVKVVPAKTQQEQEVEYYKNNPATFLSNLSENLPNFIGSTLYGAIEVPRQSIYKSSNYNSE